MARRTLIVAGGTAAIASPVMAQSATQTAIEFPIDLASLAASIATAGGTILVTAFAVGLGFVMVKKLKARLTRSV